MTIRSTSRGAGGSAFLMDGPPGRTAVINGRTCLYFGGTGYFGLHGHPRVIRAGREAFRHGTHTGTIRAGYGTHPLHLELERRLAEFFGADAAAVYASGYFNGLVLARAAVDAGDVVFIDAGAHFSVKDGAAASGRPTVVFRHLDPDDLRKRLRRLAKGRRPVLLTDGVFPALGEIAPVPALLAEIRPYGGILALDDAHGVGVLGPRGRGTLDHFGLRPSSRIRFAGTLSKAFGGYGGFTPGPERWIARVRTSAGACAGSSPLPTSLAAASIRGIEILRAHPEWRTRLGRNTARLKAGLRALGFEVGDSPVPIAAWTLDSTRAMDRLQRALWEKGIALPRLEYAGTPAGGVLRATVFSTHTAADIERLLDALRESA